MECIRCGYYKTRVVLVRSSEHRLARREPIILRRRECCLCGFRFSTSEHSQQDTITITELSAVTGVSRRTLERWVQKGYLQPIREKGRLFFVRKTTIESVKNRKKQ